MNYFVYILLCADNTLYTGYTTDIQKRLSAHNSSKAGARYTKVRRPVTLVHSESFPTKSEALKREYALKQLSRAEKLLLIKTMQD
jgi:putative endonuclease